MKIGKDGRFHTSFRYNGKLYSVAGKTEREVHQKVGEKKAQLKAGIVVKNSPVTVAQFASDWVKTYHGGDSQAEKDYHSIVNRHIIPALGSTKMRDVSEAQLQRYLNSLNLSRSRVQKIKTTLGQMFHKARKNHIIMDDPAEDLIMPPVKAGSRRSITPQERRRILSAIQGHRGKLFVMCMLYCGLRPGEAAALQWKHVDLEKRTLHIEQARKHNTMVVGPPKSKAGYRYIPIPDILFQELVARRGEPEDFVCSWDGQMIDQKKQQRMWNHIKHIMDVLALCPRYRNQITESSVAPDLTLYCLRHTYCTDLQLAGVSLYRAKVLMGHEDISVTAGIYTHATDEDAQAARVLINAKTGVEYLQNVLQNRYDA